MHSPLICRPKTIAFVELHQFGAISIGFELKCVNIVVQALRSAEIDNRCEQVLSIKGPSDGQLMNKTRCVGWNIRPVVRVFPLQNEDRSGFRFGAVARVSIHDVELIPRVVINEVFEGKGVNVPELPVVILEPPSYFAQDVNSHVGLVVSKNELHQKVK